ncbi:MAG TPA: hypothetical protein VF322_13765 [Gammaproteobacteria bacterium]
MRAALALAVLLAAAPAAAQTAADAARAPDGVEIGAGAAAGSDASSPAARRRAPLRMDDLEPAVDTSGSPSTPAEAPRPDAPVSGAVARADGPAPRARGGTVVDTLDLGTTSITGNQELPKVLYIVPWKQSDLGELVGRPANTLLDEVLAPIDPEEFERHLSYYETLHGTGQTEE